MGIIAPAFLASAKNNGLNHRDWTEFGLPEILGIMGINPNAPSDIFARSLPFSAGDTTAGAENELQAVVVGQRNQVDFPLLIESSNYYKNLLKQAAAGESSRRRITELQEFLDRNPENVWENSWVRFPRSALSEAARQVFEHDLLADKKRPDGEKRADAERFSFVHNGEDYLRIPVSYLLKLALADVMGWLSGVHEEVRNTGARLLNHFLNDNTSPEIYSFYPASLGRNTRMGRSVARETLKRFFLTQLLTLYANRSFGLSASGQKAMVYFAPHTPTRQKRLNDMISDSFYRELFMSPCLSGWDCGETKHRYMSLCHRVLSRSQINGLARLREAGIITRNLVSLPSLSNVSLANNGTHISLGSRKLTGLMADERSGFGPAQEKYIGDMAVKAMEHFLPLFVGTYSAAPYRLDFSDFHPEKVLGFLPHELDAVHLRMIWRRWKKKASLKIMGQPVTPFGLQWLDDALSRIFRLRGDFVNDFRLLDYFVCLMSTEQSPALDGALGNDRRLKKDLAEFGVFNTDMPMYLLCRLREFGRMGFSGFESRYYSQFAGIMDDMAEAVSLQNLITALVFKYILRGDISHAAIPDTPESESERRQIFFGAAIGLPTFFVRKNTPDRLMARILSRTERTRQSRRYPGYVRVYHQEYRRALVKMLQEDAADLIEMMGLEDTMKDLIHRVESPASYSAAGKLTAGILEHAGAAKPLKLSGDTFNMAAESYYRNVLRKQHIQESFSLLEHDFRTLDAYAVLRRDVYRDTLGAVLDERSAWEFLESVKPDILSDRISDADLMRLICLTVLTLYTDIKIAER